VESTEIDTDFSFEACAGVLIPLLVSNWYSWTNSAEQLSLKDRQNAGVEREVAAASPGREMLSKRRDGTQC